MVKYFARTAAEFVGSELMRLQKIRCVHGLQFCISKSGRFAIRHLESGITQPLDRGDIRAAIAKLPKVKIKADWSPIPLEQRTPVSSDTRQIMAHQHNVFHGRPKR
jgi:hypothetical protein